jgi:peptide/nickel transport system substrate-binding protein
VGKLIDNCIQEFHRIRNGIQYLKFFRLSYLRKVFSLIGSGEKIALGLLLLALTFSTVWSAQSVYEAITVPAAGSGGSYKEGVLGQPRYFNPIFAVSDADKSINQLVFSGLYKYNSDGALVPDLAEDLPKISDDEKQYTVRLKEGLLWHTGEPLTADDILFTITSIQNPETKSPLRSQWLNTEVSKTDDRTVVFTNSDVSGPFIQNLTQLIVQKKQWESVPPADSATDENNLKPVGSGPYVIKEIAQQTNGQIISVTLQASDNYFNGTPYISDITLRFYGTYEELVTAYHSNEIQGAGITAIDTNAALSSQNGSASVYTVPLAQYQAVFFNLNHPVLSDVQVRKALALATDRTELINNVLHGRAKPIHGPFIIQHLRLPDSQQTADLTAANAALDQAGWKLDPATGVRSKNNVPLQFSIATNDTSNNVRVAEFLAAEWKEVGATVTVNSMQTRELTTNLIRPRAYDALVFAQQLGADPDPFAFWHSTQTKDPGLNITSFNNAEADKLISQARTTTNEKTRQQRYLAFADIIRDQVPAIFLNQSVYLYTASNVVKGIEMGVLYDPVYRFSDMTKWYITEARAFK